MRRGFGLANSLIESPFEFSAKEDQQESSAASLGQIALMHLILVRLRARVPCASRNPEYTLPGKYILTHLSPKEHHRTEEGDQVL